MKNLTSIETFKKLQHQLTFSVTIKSKFSDIARTYDLVKYFDDEEQNTIYFELFNGEEYRLFKNQIDWVKLS